MKHITDNLFTKEDTIFRPMTAINIDDANDFASRFRMAGFLLCLEDVVDKFHTSATKEDFLGDTNLQGFIKRLNQKNDVEEEVEIMSKDILKSLLVFLNTSFSNLDADKEKQKNEVFKCLYDAVEYRLYELERTPSENVDSNPFLNINSISIKEPSVVPSNLNNTTQKPQLFLHTVSNEESKEENEEQEQKKLLNNTTSKQRF